MFSFARLSDIFAFNNKGEGANNKDLLKIHFSTRSFTYISPLNPNINQIIKMH